MPHSFRKNALSYLASSGVTTILDAIRAIVVANLLGPFTTGVCMTLLVIPQVAQYLNMGLIEALVVATPPRRGRGEEQVVHHIFSTALNGTVWISVVTCAVVGIVGTSMVAPSSGMLGFFWAAVALIPLWELKQFFVTHLQIEERFLTLSLVEAGFTILTVALQIPLVIWLGGTGFWAAFLVANAVVIGYVGAHYFRRYPLPSFRIDWSWIRRLASLGIVLLVSAVTYAPFLLIVRGFLAAATSMSEVGYFFLSMALIGKIAVISNAVAKIIMPRISFMNGQGENFPAIFRLFRRAQLLTFAVTIGICALGYAFLQPVIGLILPDYLPGVGAARIMLVAALPYCLIDNANNVVLALQHRRLYLKNLFAALAFLLILLVGMWKFGWVTAASMSAALGVVFAFYALLANRAVFNLQAHRFLCNSENVPALSA